MSDKWIVALKKSKKYTDEMVTTGGAFTNITRDADGNLIFTWAPAGGSEQTFNAGVVPAGKSITDAQISSDGHLILTFDDASTLDAGIAKGDKGDKGDPGDPGGVPEAPSDGKPYARQDGSWESVDYKANKILHPTGAATFKAFLDSPIGEVKHFAPGDSITTTWDPQDIQELVTPFNILIDPASLSYPRPNVQYANRYQFADVSGNWMFQVNFVCHKETPQSSTPAYKSIRIYRISGNVVENIPIFDETVYSGSEFSFASTITNFVKTFTADTDFVNIADFFSMGTGNSAMWAGGVTPTQETLRSFSAWTKMTAQHTLSDEDLEDVKDTLLNQIALQSENHQTDVEELSQRIDDLEAAEAARASQYYPLYDSLYFAPTHTEGLPENTKKLACPVTTGADDLHYDIALVLRYNNPSGDPVYGIWQLPLVSDDKGNPCIQLYVPTSWSMSSDDDYRLAYMAKGTAPSTPDVGLTAAQMQAYDDNINMYIPLELSR